MWKLGIVVLLLSYYNYLVVMDLRSWTYLNQAILILKIFTTSLADTSLGEWGFRRQRFKKMALKSHFFESLSPKNPTASRRQPTSLLVFSQNENY